MASLDISNNNIGELVMPEGWGVDYFGGETYRHEDGRVQNNDPSQPVGVLALADAIQDMGALASLNLANNYLEAEGAQCLAKVLPAW